MGDGKKTDLQQTLESDGTSGLMDAPGLLSTINQQHSAWVNFAPGYCRPAMATGGADEALLQLRQLLPQ